MPSEAAGSVNHPRAAGYDTPWQRLPWTGPLALVAWALALWTMALGLTKAPAMPDRVPPINARFIELPKPAALEPPPVVRPDPPPQQPRKIAKPPPAAAQPVAAQPQAPSAPETAPSAAPPAPDSAQASGLPAPDAAPASGPSAQGAAPGAAAARPGGRSRAGSHPGATVRAGAVGVVQAPLAQSIHNEENIFDTDGTGNGASPGGWSQEYNDDCHGDLFGWERSCGPLRFSQQPTPWCHDANPYMAWEVGSCKIELDKAVAAFKRKDYDAALAGFTKLAGKDYFPAQSNLGAMYAEGSGVPKDDQQAAHWYGKAAAAGDAKALYNLALMYSDGTGVPRDEQRAAVLFRKAAYFGYGLAQYNLGVLYALGTGVPRDDRQAAYWYRKAADRGHAVAQYNLGVLYEFGTGVPRNEQQAVYWYCKGTVRGEDKAQASLGQLYATGTDVARAEELTYFCWLLSADKRAAQIAYQDRDLYEKKLTPEQIANAKTAAGIWKRQ